MTQGLLLVDQPYVSGHLRRLIERRGLPLVLTPAARQLGFREGEHTLSEAQAVAAARAADRVRVYTSSENALPWVTRNLPFTGLPSLLPVFKDKARFREVLQPRFPDFFFREVSAAELGRLSVDDLPLPVVLKPAVGFFSLGVLTVTDPAEWANARHAIEAKMEAARTLYPEDVLGTGTFLIEERVEGQEFAIDAYYDEAGDPVVLGIWAHAFASDRDTSDRVYTTSVDIVRGNLEPFRACLAEIGRLTGARDIPVHLELRRGADGRLTPIELNPLRFGGWCTTGDVTRHAWGFSPYVYFLEQRRPDWPTLLADSDDARYSIVVLDNSTGIDGRDIAAFDYDALMARFHDPLELRRVDFTHQPMFGFVFLATPPEHQAELDWVLRSDLTEFVTPRSAASAIRE